MPDSGKLLTHRHHICSTIHSVFTPSLSCIVAYLGGVHTIGESIGIMLLWVTNITASMHITNAKSQTGRAFFFRYAGISFSHQPCFDHAPFDHIISCLGSNTQVHWCVCTLAAGSAVSRRCLAADWPPDAAQASASHKCALRTAHFQFICSSTSLGTTTPS